MKDRHIVSARKYRPSTFSSMVGQEALTRTLRNAIDTDRLAQAYLFCGPRGVGKTSCARIFAKTINCTHRNADGEACGECESCRDFDSGNSYNVIELDAASNNGVDNMRNLTDQVNVPPQIGKYRVFIIDEVHMLSSQAFNAFLKTLEEPPSYAVFILATTEKNKVIPTILSRCQIYDFKRISVPDIVDHLRHVAESEGIEAEEQALDIIARKSDGAMRDALSIFDQVSAASSGRIRYADAIDNLNVLDFDYYFRFADAFLAGDVQGALMLFAEVVDKGFDAHFFINGLAAHIRNLMVAITPATLPLLDASRAVAEKYAEQARCFDAPWYYKALELLTQCDLDYRNSSSKRLLVELALIRLCRLGKQEDVPHVNSDVPKPQPAAPGPAASPSAAPAAPKAEPAPKPHAEPVEKKAASSASVKNTATQEPAPAPRQTKSRVVVPNMNITTIRQHALTRGNESLPLRGLKKDKKEEGGEEGEKAHGKRNAPYTGEKLREAWIDYITSHPEEVIVVNAMRANMPEKKEGDIYTLRVANQSQQNMFDGTSNGLVEFIRDALGNDNFQLQVEVAELREEEKPLSAGDQLSLWIKDNPSLGELINTIDAEFI